MKYEIMLNIYYVIKFFNRCDLDKLAMWSARNMVHGLYNVLN